MAYYSSVNQNTYLLVRVPTLKRDLLKRVSTDYKEQKPHSQYVVCLLCQLLHTGLEKTIKYWNKGTIGCSPGATLAIAARYAQRQLVPTQQAKKIINSYPA